jgi:hypothetical protein
MEKKRFKSWIDIITLLDVFILIVSGILVFYLLNKGIWLYTNLIFSRQQWFFIFYSSIILLIIISLARIFFNLFKD